MLTTSTVATVPDAAAKSSVIGKQISRLGVQGRNLIPAFGDYQLNLGPLAMVSLDMDTHVLSSTEATLTVEQLWTLRLIDGLLYAPFMDPQGTNAEPENGQYAVRTSDGTWTTITTVTGVTHAFDVAVSSDGMWVCGSNEAEGKAVVWRSTDNGATWAESVTVSDEATIGTDGPRFYAFAQFGDDMIVFGKSFDGLALFAYRWSSGGSDWTLVDPYPVTGEPITGTPCAFTMNGADFVVGMFHGKDSDPTIATSLWAITRDGSASGVAFPANAFDVEVSNGHLWLLADDRHIWRGDSDGTWHDAYVVDDDTAVSLAIDTDTVYFGTTDSRIISAAFPA